MQNFHNNARNKSSAWRGWDPEMGPTQKWAPTEQERKVCGAKARSKELDTKCQK